MPEKGVERCDICHDELQRRGEDWGTLCPNCADAMSSFLDDTGLDNQHVETVVGFLRKMLRRVSGRSGDRGLRLRVPTYYGSGYPDAVADGLVPEFGAPFVPMLAYGADGLRIVLGAHDDFDFSAPDVQIERHPRGWAIFLRPDGGGDASGYIYFIDDGRSFVVPEHGSTPPIEAREWEEVVAMVDRKERQQR